MTTPTTTPRVPLWAWGVIGAAIACEAASNGLRAYDLGHQLAQYGLAVGTLEVSIAGAVLVLGSLALSGTQTRAAWVALTSGTPAAQRIVAAGIGALCLAASIAAMASHISEAQRAKSGHEVSDRGRYDRTKVEYDAVAGELKSLDGTRTTTQVRAALDGARVQPTIWHATRQCTDAELLRGRVNNEACREVLDLRQEMARAIRKAELEPKADALRTELSALRPPAAAQAIEMLIGGWWGWGFGLCVVLVATFGPVVFGSTGRPPSPASVADGDGQPAAISAAALSAAAVIDPAPAEVALPAADSPALLASPKLDEADSLDDIRSAVTAGERYDVSEYAARWGVNASESSRRIRDFEQRGEIKTEAEGRRKVVSWVRPQLRIATSS